MHNFCRHESRRERRRELKRCGNHRRSTAELMRLLENGKVLVSRNLTWLKLPCLDVQTAHECGTIGGGIRIESARASLGAWRRAPESEEGGAWRVSRATSWRE